MLERAVLSMDGAGAPVEVSTMSASSEHCGLQGNHDKDSYKTGVVMFVRSIFVSYIWDLEPLLPVLVRLDEVLLEVLDAGDLSDVCTSTLACLNNVGL